jgi:predicted nucleic acid-binding protein
MAHLIDSSVWIALFLQSDTQHRKAGRIIDTIRGKIYVPYCVVSEVATVLTYKHSKVQADAFCRYLDAHKDIFLINNVIEDELSFFVNSNVRISFTDTALLFLTRRLPATLITFDKQLEQAKKRRKD